MSTLKCLDCGHENEAQRVYCHSCGAKLDRSGLVDEAKKTPTKKPRRKIEVSDVMSRFFKNFIKAAFFAVLAAGLIQAARPPKNAPAEGKVMGADIIDAPSISLEMEEAAESPRRLGYNEGQLNAYLKNRIKPPKNPTIPAWAMIFDSAFVNLQQGSFRVTKKFRVFSQPVYVGGTYVPTVEAGKFAVQPLAGHIGSLPIPGMLFGLVDEFMFGDFVTNMKQEGSAANKMKSFEVTPKMVIITSGAARP